MSEPVILRLTADESAQWNTTEQGWDVRAFFVARARNEWREGREVRVVDESDRILFSKDAGGAEKEWRNIEPLR